MYVSIIPTISVGKISKGMIFLKGLFEGTANPLINKLLYLSSSPLTKIPLPSTFEIPVTLVNPSSTSLIPLRDIS